MTLQFGFTGRIKIFRIFVSSSGEAIAAGLAVHDCGNGSLKATALITPVGLWFLPYRVLCYCVRLVMCGWLGNVLSMAQSSCLQVAHAVQLE